MNCVNTGRRCDELHPQIGIDLDHLRALPCSEGRYIYHLFGKQVYRLIGQGDSQSRRLKSGPEIERRLSALDYVLPQSWNPEFCRIDRCQSPGTVCLRSELRRRPWGFAAPPSFRPFQFRLP